MALTRLDCQLYRGKSASLSTSNFVALNPSRRPGSLVAAGACAVKESIGSQVACKISIEHFVDGVLAYFDKKERGGEHAEPPNDGSTQEISLEILESAFRRANTSVYDFGHKLAAGGRMAASFIGLVIQNKVIAAGRVGGGSAYLFRGKELFPFFESAKTDKSSPSLDAFLGSNSLVSVELASIDAVEGDIIAFSSSTFDSGQEALLVEALTDSPQTLPAAMCDRVSESVFRKPLEVPFFILAKVGPEAIYLK